jgi:hypothetical protein
VASEGAPAEAEALGDSGALCHSRGAIREFNHPHAATLLRVDFGGALAVWFSLLLPLNSQICVCFFFFLIFTQDFHSKRSPTCADEKRGSTDLSVLNISNMKRTLWI